MKATLSSRMFFTLGSDIDGIPETRPVTRVPVPTRLLNYDRVLCHKFSFVPMVSKACLLVARSAQNFACTLDKKESG